MMALKNIPDNITTILSRQLPDTIVSIDSINQDINQCE